MNKSTLTAVLVQYFKENPGRTVSFKDIFRELKLNTHPLKMLAIDDMEQLPWEDFITRVSYNSYCLRDDRTQVEEGVFVRKPNGRNSFQPLSGGKPVLVAERNSLFAMNGDRVRVSFMAHRRNHTREAQVIEIVERARDTFVGTLCVDDDVAFVVMQDGLLATDILVPKKRLKGARTNDKVVVKVMRWPDSSNRQIIGEVVDVLGRSGTTDAEMNSILVQ